MSLPFDLPTKAQIGAITDVEVLGNLADDLEREIVKIEAQLEFGTGESDDWANRAANALGLFRYTLRLVNRRLSNLAQTRKALPSIRPEEDRHPFTREVLATRPAIDVAALPTIEAVERASAWVAERLDALDADREDEIAQAPTDRDEGFLAATRSALRALGAIRTELARRHFEIARDEQRREVLAANATRERMFIDAARAILTGEVFASIWARVDQAQAEQAEAA